MSRHYAHHRARLKRLTNKQKKILIQRAVLLVAIIEPLMTIPQIYEVWAKHQVAGVSLWTWSMYIGAAVIWLLYGFQLKDKPLIISSTLWVITEAAVVLGIFFNS